MNQSGMLADICGIGSSGRKSLWEARARGDW
jgi:hypothetical protein